MAIKIEMLRCFAIVAEKGNLQAAAEQLGRTPSAVSMMLKQLEEHLEGKLFEKDRKNRLTDLGGYVLQQARNELNHFDATVNAIETYASNPTGLIRIASVPSMISNHVIPAVEEFSLCFPNVKIDVRDMDSRSVVNSLVSGFIELGIASKSGVVKGVSQKPLVQDDFGLICHKDHPLANQTGSVKLSDLEASRFVSNDLCFEIDDRQVLEFLEGARLSAQNTLSLIEMLNSGSWYTILPSGVVTIQPDKLVFRQIEHLEAKRTVSLLFREECETIPYFSKFIQILDQQTVKSDKRSGFVFTTLQNPAEH